MKKVFKVLVLLLNTLLLCSCEDQTSNIKFEPVITEYIFIGESDSWSGECIDRYTSTLIEETPIKRYENQNTREYIFTYKHDVKKLETAKEITITYNSIVGKGSLKQTSEDGLNTKEGSFKIISSSNNSIHPNEDDVIEVIVTLDGISETFTMTLSE